MTAEVEHSEATYNMCVNPSTVVSVNVDEHTPLLRSSSRELQSGSHYSSSYGYNSEETNKFSWLLVIALFLFFLFGMSIGTYLLLNEDTKYIPEIYKVITRSEWNASTSYGPLSTILHPFDNVVITDTGTATCDNVQSCCAILRDFEQHDYRNFHFFIDMHGNIFEGLGWHQIITPQQHTDEIDFRIALLGNYDDLSPSRKQMSTIRTLVEVALSNNVLKTCYTVKIPQSDIRKLSLIDLESVMQLDSYRECMR